MAARAAFTDERTFGQRSAGNELGAARTQTALNTEGTSSIDREGLLCPVRTGKFA